MSSGHCNHISFTCCICNQVLFTLSLFGTRGHLLINLSTTETKTKSLYVLYSKSSLLYIIFIWKQRSSSNQVVVNQRQKQKAFTCCIHSYVFFTLFLVGTRGHPLVNKYLQHGRNLKTQKQMACLSFLLFSTIFIRKKYNLASQITTISLDGPLNYQGLHSDPSNYQNL